MPKGQSKGDVSAQRKRYRARYPDKIRAEGERRRDRCKALGLSTRGTPLARDGAFVGVDGEGAGTDTLGRQCYRLLRAGRRELWQGGRPLPTRDCLEFLLAAPAGALLVGFCFTYDVTQILADLGEEHRAKLLLRDKAKQAAHVGYTYNYVYWERYAIDWRPRRYLRVARINPVTNRLVPGTGRTIWEAYDNFRLPFLAALKLWRVGRRHWPAIVRGKAARGTADKLTAADRNYCKLECDLLARIMEKWRAASYAAGLAPANWSGAGTLASSLCRTNRVVKASEIAAVLPAGFEDFARRGFFGGRSETPTIGQVPGLIYDYDIRSAYPAAMLTLPCLRHGRWERTAVPAQLAGLYVAEAAYRHAKAAWWGTLPHREKATGVLSWPRAGQGVYWSVEIEAARRAGADVQLGPGWRYERRCDCHPFGFLHDLFAKRREAGPVQGRPVKHAINALWGLMARRGAANGYQNYIWAGLLTATVRARLVDALAAAVDPRAVLLLATDQLLSLEPLPLSIGDGLGDWRAATHQGGVFIAGAGMYWGAVKRRTKGIPLKFLAPHIDTIEATFRGWLANGFAQGATVPTVNIPLETFISLRAAGHGAVTLQADLPGLEPHGRANPDLSGVWRTEMRTLRLAWNGKRALIGMQQSADGGAVLAPPPAGAWNRRSADFDGTDKSITLIEQDKRLTEGLPDAIDLGSIGFG